jgi:DNA topoisomerase-1
MKFSTLTKPDLVKSYENKLKTIEWGQAHAGETRHFLDWMYGINLSRALSTAIRKAGLFKTLSSGRVQGPSLKLIVDKEKEIRKFIPTPYWTIEYKGEVNSPQSTDPCLLIGEHKKNKFLKENEAKEVFEKIDKKDGEVSDIEKRETKSQPPTPFDLTTLQTEAFRSLKIHPKDSLAIAQELYTKGYTSYPRTSSQQLPKELGLKKLIEGGDQENFLRAGTENLHSIIFTVICFGIEYIRLTERITKFHFVRAMEVIKFLFSRISLL